ncbi:MAG: methyltransferase family protein [Candidatus Binatia bacterium]
MTALADGVVVAAWGVVLLHNAALALRGGATLGRLVVATTFVAVLGATGVALERMSGGRLGTSPVLALVGGALVVGGAVLHVEARRTLGTRWSARIAPASGDGPLDSGPYAVVRHPLYLALGLIALGSMLAHPSVATACAALGMTGGLALKIRGEERALAHTFGPRWDVYRARVPCILPRLSSGRPG